MKRFVLGCVLVGLLSAGTEAQIVVVPHTYEQEEFDSDVFVAAAAGLGDIGVTLSGIEVRQSKAQARGTMAWTAPRYAVDGNGDLLLDGNGCPIVERWEVMVMPNGLRNAFPGHYGAGGGFTDPSYWAGVLQDLLLHEWLHTCLEHHPPVKLPAGHPGFPEACGVPWYHEGDDEEKEALESQFRARNQRRSCHHAFIDLFVHGELCRSAMAVSALLTQKKLLKASQSPPDEGLCDEIDMLEDVLEGLCDAMRRLEDKWNNEKGARRIRDCILAREAPDPTGACTGGFDWPEFDNPPSATNPPGPGEGDSGFADDVVLTVCEPCTPL